MDQEVYNVKSCRHGLFLVGFCWFLHACLVLLAFMKREIVPAFYDTAMIGVFVFLFITTSVLSFMAMTEAFRGLIRFRDDFHKRPLYLMAKLALVTACLSFGFPMFFFIVWSFV